MTGVLVRKGRVGFRDTKRTLWGDGGRDWSDISINQGMPKIAGNHQKLGEKHTTDSFLELQREHGLANTLISNL